MDQIKIYDVAGAAGVSLATVSRVLNHPEKVRKSTREKIERIIKELGYKPNLNARGLASSKTTTVAVVVPELARSSVAEMINGVAACAERRGYLLRLFVTGNREKERSQESEKSLWGDVIASGVDGVLYINDEIQPEQLDIIKDVNTHVVLTNTVCDDETIPSVSIDYKKAAYDITKEMIGQGNKDIWLITTVRKYHVNELKVEGYINAMNEAGLEPKVVTVSGKTNLNELSYEALLRLSHPEVAIIVRDSMAVSFINVARNLHISIPNQLQVIGFQNTRYAELSRPKLTCINTPIYELGEKAMSLLTTLMEVEGEVKKQVLIDFNVIWRESTKRSN